MSTEMKEAENTWIVFDRNTSKIIRVVACHEYMITMSGIWNNSYSYVRWENFLRQTEELKRARDAYRQLLDDWNEVLIERNKARQQIEKLESVAKAARKIRENWDVSNPERIVPKWHKGELAPNDSLAAGAIMFVIDAVNALDAVGPS